MEDDLECKREGGKAPIESCQTQVQIWGVPRLTEPSSRPEKVGDKGREIQDHAITGPPVPSTPVCSPFPNSPSPSIFADGLVKTINYVSGTGVGATTTECRRRDATLNDDCGQQLPVIEGVAYI